MGLPASSTTSDSRLWLNLRELRQLKHAHLGGLHPWGGGYTTGGGGTGKDGKGKGKGIEGGVGRETKHLQ